MSPKHIQKQKQKNNKIYRSIKH